MIVRWYMALNEFSFNLEFIRGVDNNIADAMSRLCRNNMINSPNEYSNSRIFSVISRSFKPNDILYSKIGRLHNSTVGHFGVNIWKYQRQHVKWFINHCPCCQKMSVLKIPTHAHGFTSSTYSRMDCQSIDFICLFPDKGYILIIVCTFTSWVELYATIDATAHLTAEYLLQHYG